MNEVKEKGVQLVAPSTVKITKLIEIIQMYNEMIRNASKNIGAKTNNGVLITEKFITRLISRRDELIKKDWSLYKEKGCIVNE